MVLDEKPTFANVTGRIVAEGLVVCETEGLLQAFCVWMATYYAFNCSYPPQYKNSLAFLQKAMLGLHCGLKAPLVTTIMKKLGAASTRN